MTEIWNLSAVCRCCHKDGYFKSLQEAYVVENSVEIYSVLLRDTLGIIINPPPIEASYTICDECILNLRNAYHFKKKVLDCEQKFQEYCRNEQSLTSDVKVEVQLGDHNFEDRSSDRDDDTEIKDEVALTENYKDTQFSEYPIKVENDFSLPVPIKKARKKKQVQKKLQTDRSLEVQLKTENGKIYSCKECGGIYDKLKELRRHIHDSHRRQWFKCEFCPKLLKSEVTLKNHIALHSGETPFKCVHCDKSLSTKKALSDHMVTHTNQKRFQCDLCQKFFKYKQTLNQHFKWHNGTNKKCVCDICGHSFNDRTNLRIHVETVHSKIRKYVCSVCSKSFTAKKHLTVHFRLHSGEKPYSCDVCSESFHSSDNFKRHQAKHEAGEKVYECVVCRKAFTHRSSFKLHVRRHAGKGVLPHKCPFCPKDFTCKYSMRRHMEIHTGAKPHVCNICQKTFTQKAQIKRHINTVHDPEKATRLRKRCELCKKNVNNLEKHIQSHNNRPYACSLCEKSYPEQNALNRHVKISHLGTKHHCCKLCSKKYAKIESLRGHMVKVHKTTLKAVTEEGFEGDLKAYNIDINKEEGKAIN